MSHQGIGGYVYDKMSLMKMEGYMPEGIIVALGTNQYEAKSMRDVEEFYQVLTEIYPDIPIICITPLWRGDQPEKFSIFVQFCNGIKEVVKKYKTVTVIDGFRLIPHLSEYFLDDLHPNKLGMEVYGRNLVDEIRECPNFPK